MKIRSVQTLDVIDLNDVGAQRLIDAGIYVRAEDAPEAQSEPKSATQPKGRKPSR